VGTRLVVDASVAAKWLLPEPDSAAAASLLEDAGTSLHVPELFDAELGNVLWKRVQRDELKAGEATSLAVLIGGIPATRHTHADLLEGAVGVALDLSITVYDALYVALAQALGAPLATADGWLAERARKVVEIRELGRE
jgi:predicted nucleic acid-binding protein